MNRAIVGIIVAAFGAAVFWAAGPVMRETDQASLIDGAWQLQQGKSPLAPGFHIYDKQFLSYAIVAAAMPKRGTPFAPETVRDLVERINRVATGLFLGGLLVFAGCFCRRPFRCRGVGLPLLIFLAAPVVLLSAPLASSAVISGAFVLMLAGILALRPSPLQSLAAGVLAFLAVGSRADAVLCLPILCWATVRKPGWEALWRTPNHWAMAAGSIGALVTGQWLAGGSSPAIYESFFEPAVFTTYLVFGLGGVLLLAAVMIAGFGQWLNKRHGFWLAGIVFLALPLGFYGWQLFSPRHLMTMALAVLIASTGWRGRALWRWGGMTGPRLRGTFAGMAGALALIPLAIGLHLPDPKTPRLVADQATRFPTADGLWPMGATASFLSALRAGSSEPLDHNQAIWIAATGDEVHWPESNPVPVLETPMRRYLFLALRWAGREPVLVAASERNGWDGMRLAVADERSLRTLNPGQVNPGGLARYDSYLSMFRGADLEVISPDIDGYAIVKLNREGASRPERDDDSAFQVRRTLAVVLENEELKFDRKLAVPASFELSRIHEGKTLAFTSRRPFTIDEVSANPVTDLDGSPLYAFVIPGSKTVGRDSLAIQNGSPITVWTTPLPDYMSRNRFRSDRENTATQSSGRWLPRGIAARSGNSAARGASAP